MNTIEERLATIEASMAHVVAMIEDMRAEMRATKYITADICEAQRKLHDAQIDALRHEIDIHRHEIEGVYKAINGVSARLEDMRKSWSGRLWAIAIPILAALAASFVALAGQAK